MAGGLQIFLDTETTFLNEELRRIGRAPVQSVVAKVTDSLPLAREMYPGKSNSLDALGERLEVDNTSRTLHARCSTQACSPRSTRYRSAVFARIADEDGIRHRSTFVMSGTQRRRER